MKKLSFIYVSAIAAFAAPISAWALSAGICMSSLCATSMLPCCCPTGETVVSYTCPLLWSDSGNTGTCTRAGTSASDNIGYYTQNYGTCAATRTEKECFIAVARNATNGRNCFCLSTN